MQNPTVEWKACRRCGQNKAAAEFYRNKTNADGLYNNCKACFTQDAHNRRERLPPLEERTAASKECRRCKETKPASEFYKNKHMSDGLYTHCKVSAFAYHPQLPEGLLSAPILNPASLGAGLVPPLAESPHIRDFHSHEKLQTERTVRLW